MKNSDTLEKKMLATKSMNLKKNIQTTEDETLKVRLNKDHVLVVNKQKLLEKSHYFKSITKSCFADHKSEFTEVTIPVKFESFQKVIEYIITDKITLSNDTAVEIYPICDYLQIEDLSEMCFDYFVYNLNIKTLDQQLNLMEKFPIFYKDFNHVALKFKESGRPSVKGLFLLEYKSSAFGREINMQTLTDDGSQYVVNFDINCALDLLHNFCNSLIIHKFNYVGNPSAMNLLQYDLTNGKLIGIEVENYYFSSICSDDKNLFLINPIEYNKIYNFSLTILRKNGDGLLKVYTTKKFSLCNLDKTKIQKDCNILIFFSICYDGKLSFFYKYYSKSHASIHNVLMVTICIETMTIVNNSRLTESLRYGTGGVKTQKENIEKIVCTGFLKLFFLKKSQKVFIEICKKNDVILVFDAKRGIFFFEDALISQSHVINKLNVKCSVDKDDLVYMYRIADNKIYLPLEVEIKAFQYSNGKLVDTGIKRIYRKKSKYSAACMCIV